MATKAAVKLKNILYFSSQTVGKRLIFNNFTVRRQNLSYKSVSFRENLNNWYKFFKKNYERPVVSLASTGLGLYLLNRYNFINVLPIVNADIDIPRAPKSARHMYNFIADIVEKSANAVVCVELEDVRFGRVMSTPQGSGFIVKDDGLILTNAHVIMNRSRGGNIKVRLKDGKVFDGYIEDFDTSLDLATIRINAKNLPVMSLGTSSDLRAGEWVVAIGSPLSLTDSVTAGVVSSPQRLGKELGVKNQNMRYIQTDAAITFGNSGGPLVNLDGEVIGVNAMKVTSGISFAIPIEYGKEFLKRSEERRSLKNVKPKQATPNNKRGYVGISIMHLTPDVTNELIRSDLLPPSITSGVIISRIILGSPADYGGLEPGDVILSLDGKPIDGSTSFFDAFKPNEEIKMKVFRKGRLLDVRILPTNQIIF